MLARSISTLVGLLLLSAGAHAQGLFRAYLASDGNDANPCTLAAPCRLLPRALEQIASRGEVWMLDSANYNIATVTVAKSATILAVPGAVGSMVATAGGPAVAIGAAGLRVVFRNIVIGPVAGGSAGTGGIAMTGASELVFENGTISDLPGDGIFASGGGFVRVAHSTIQKTQVGVRVQNGATGTVASSKLYDNVRGAIAETTFAITSATLTVVDCVIEGGQTGVGAHNTFGFDSHMNITRASVTRTTISRTSVPLEVFGGDNNNANINVGGSTIVENGSAWFANGNGAVWTLGDNQFANNGSGTGPLLAMPATPR